MGDFSIYIIKVAVMLSILFSVYKLTAGRLKCASLQRAILFAIYPISLLIPFLKQEWFMTSADKPVQNFDWATLATLTNNAAAQSTGSNPIVDAIVLLMIGGSIIGGILFLIGIIRIVKCRFSGKSRMIGDMHVIVVSEPTISPFSFGGRIYLSETDYKAHNEMIIAHESSHIRHRHYLDLLFGRCIAIIQWWNPLAWLMLREIHDVHEFQADNDVISQGHDMHDYQYLLLREAVGPKFQYMTDSFNHSSLKARLSMINRKGTKNSTRLISLLCIPAAIAGSLAISSDTFANIINPLASAFESNENHRDIPGEIMDTTKFNTTYGTGKAIEEGIIDNNIYKENTPVVSTGNSETIQQASTIPTEEAKTEIAEIHPLTPEVVSNQIEPASIVHPLDITIIDTGTIKKNVDNADTHSQTPQDPIVRVGSQGPDAPDYMIDGKLVSYESLNTLDPSIIKSISVFKDADKHPNGLIVVELLTSEEIANKENLK